MENSTKKTLRYTRLLCSLAIIGAFFSVLADCFSGWSNHPNAMSTAFSLSMENIRGLFITKPRWEYVLGNYMAIIFLPFHIVGSFLIYLTLKPINRLYAKIFFIPAVYLAVIGSGYHGTYAFVGDIIQSGNQTLMEKMTDYWLYWGVALVFGYTVLVIYLFFLVFMGKSILPRWLAAISPLSIIVYTSLITLILPNTMVGIKSFLTVTGLNMPLFIFYLLTTHFLLRFKSIELKFP